MAAGARDHEPPAVLATVAVLLAPLSLWMGIIVPAADMARHVTLEVVFGVVCVLCGLRAAHLAGRRRAVRAWAWIGLVLGALGLVMTGWQLLTFATDGAFPPPFWSPYARR